MTYRRLTKYEMAARVALDVPDGAYVNLGIGIPTLVADALPPDREVVFHAENGVLGVGGMPHDRESSDPDLINASKQRITLLPGASFVHHTDSFLMIRGGHIDVTVLGAYQVSQDGDLANWTTNDHRLPPAVGGAMDLAVGAKQVFVTMTHTTKALEPKIRETCDYPLTAPGVVNRIFTDLAVIDVNEGGLIVREMVGGITAAELQDLTGALLTFPETVGVLP